MDVILQIGAHRTASTSFQTYLRQSNHDLAALGIGFWGPLRTRKGLFHGVIPNKELGQGPIAFARAQGRIAMQLERSSRLGLTQTIVSDENMLGVMRHNISAQRLYPSAGERIARYMAAFCGSIKTIHLSIRCQSDYWASALSFCIPRGVLVPKSTRMDALVAQARDWRDVITDISAAAPSVPIFVSTYEQFGARPTQLLSYLIAQPAPPLAKQIWRNQRPRAQELLRLPLSDSEHARLSAQVHANTWVPFTEPQNAFLQERYADDLFWLRSGADGLAHFLEDQSPTETGYPAELGAMDKGQTYEQRHRLARPG